MIGAPFVPLEHPSVQRWLAEYWRWRGRPTEGRCFPVSYSREGYWMKRLTRASATPPCTWKVWTKVDRDYFLAEYLVETIEDGELTISNASVLLASLSKVNPRVKHKTAWKVLEGFRAEAPVKQAPVRPPEAPHRAPRLRLRALYLSQPSSRECPCTSSSRCWL